MVAHLEAMPAILSLSIFAVLRAWGVSVEERREPFLWGLDGSILAADILARHTPGPL